MRATSTVPSGPRIDCGVSTWISNRREPSASPRAASSRPHTSTIASTCSTEVTFGRVTTNPSVSPPAACSVSTNDHRLASPRRRVGASKLLNRMPCHGGAVPDRTVSASASAAAVTAASSSASGRVP